MKELQPVNQQVLLDFEQPKETTQGGIIIPDTAKEKPKFAKVVALSGIENAEISVGDSVFYKEYSGTEINFEGEDYLLVPYADIMAKIVETDEI
ncbi:MAG: co-chaperone GroES [Bacteroidota bacterium]|nr:co-chaperone GroES [Bacteroidota bacterium]